MNPHLTQRGLGRGQCGLGRGLPAAAYLRSVTKWHLDPSSRLATIDTGRVG